jgi:phosphoglycerol transferase MdoB-like AlkP superfamily enzyme
MHQNGSPHTSRNIKTKNPKGVKIKMPRLNLLAPALGLALFGILASAQGADKKPNILVIMGDDIGWFNLGSYNQGIMLETTPNLDQLAKEGLRLTDYYAEASCTAGPANFITGELPIRTGLTTETDDPTVEPRWGKVGKQKIVDEGPLPPNPIEGIKYNMETSDEVVTESTIAFMNKAKEEDKPFFVWMNPTRAHVLTHLSPKYDAMRNPETDFGLEEAALKQMDDNVGVVLNWLKENGLDENTIVVFTTDNGAEVYTWPDGGTTPFAGAKGEVTEGSFRVPAIIRWPGHVKPDSVSNGIMSGLDWFPTLVAAAGNPDIANELLKGKPLGDQTPSRCIWTVMTRQTCSLTKGLASATRSGTLPRPSLGRCGWITTSISSSNSRKDGSAQSSIPICRY